MQGQSLALLTEKHKGYSEILLEHKQTYTISKNKEKLKITRDTYEEYFLLQSNKNNYTLSDYTIFSELNPLVSFDAYTLSLQNDKYKKIVPKGISESAYNRNSVFHSDIKKKVVNFSGLVPGSKRILSFTHEFEDPFLLHPFRIMSHVPSEKVIFEIILDKDIALAFKTFHTEKTNIEYKQESRRGKTIHRWTLSNPPLLKIEANSPAAAYFVPSIYFWITSYQSKNKSIQLLGEVDQLYAYYFNFIKNLNLDLNQDFIDFTADLTKEVNTEEDKVKIIYQWVQQNIKYIAFEAGYDGFIPRKADLVFTRRYGDCKDMASIITAMCHLAGVNTVYMAWVGTRDIPYSYYQLPTPQVDNHMIAFYDSGTDGICLDATNSFLPFGMIPRTIQTKELLIAFDSTTYKIHKLPITPGAKNKIRTIDYLQIDNLTLIGQGELNASGYFKSIINANFTYGGKKNRDEITEQLVNKEIAKLKLTKVHAIEHLDLSNQDVSIRFDYTIPNAVIAAGKELYVDLNLYKPFHKKIITLPRETPYEVEQLEHYDSQVILAIPQGYRIKYLPAKEQISTDYIEASFEFKAMNQSIELHAVVTSKKLMLYPEDFSAWNESIKKLNANYLESIILEKI